MNRKDNETYEMLSRVASFATTNVERFPESSAASEIAAALETGVKILTEEAGTIAAAEMAIRAGGNVRAVARKNLKTTLGHVSVIGETLGSDKFTLPAKHSDRVLIHTGRAFASEAEPLKKEFARHGLPVEAIIGTVTALEEAIRSGSAARATRVASFGKWTAALEQALVAAKKFDVLVATTLPSEPGLLAAYESARTVHQSRVRKAEDTHKTASPAIATATAA